jgi:endoglucanase
MRSLVRKLTVSMASLSVLCSTGCRAQQPWPLWDSYTARFVDNQGRVIDHTAGDKTTSEGEAYAMFFALVANDRNRFDKLLGWIEANLAQGDLTLHLPSWSWGKAPDGSWRALDTNSASDADLWMAYTLSEAGRLWHSDRYSKLGSLLAARVAQQEVAMTPAGMLMLPGEQGFHPSDSVWFVNPSYMPPQLLAYFAKQDPQGPWAQLLASLPQVVETSGGFAMDWMQVNATGIQPSAPPSVIATLDAGKSAPTPAGSYDAIRVYLWAGLADPKTPHVREVVSALHGMTNLLATSVTPPQTVGPEGQVLDPNGPVGFSAAVVPFLYASGHRVAARTQQDRLTAMRDPASGLYGKTPSYYDQNLALFQDGWLAGRFTFDAQGGLHLKWK